jgi:hypothetical protein
MRFVWTDAGDDPDINHGDAHGITGYFMPAFDSVTTKAFLRDEVQARGKVAGVYIGHGWMSGLSPAQYAAKANAEYKRLLLPGLRVQFNLEDHDPEAIASTFEEWRKLQPTVGTSWALEGMQGGWMPPNFVSRILAARVRVVPESFSGNMQRVESDRILRDLLVRGIPETSISIFYDAAQLGIDWDGFAFTMGRLP